MQKLIDKFIFPGVKGKYTADHPLLHQICRQPPFDDFESTSPAERIPFIFLKNRGLETRRTILYFHGNGEDATSWLPILEDFNYAFQSNSCVVEYPGYGVYAADRDPSRMLTDADAVFEFLTGELGIPAEDVIIFGRSLGTGPAISLASKTPKCRMLLLMSAYKGLKDILRDNFFYRLLSGSYREHFTSVANIRKVTCPVFMIHGAKDKVIQVHHSRELFGKCRSGVKDISTPPEMTHNNFRVYDHLINPIAGFMRNRLEMDLKVQRVPVQQEPSGYLDRLQRYQYLNVLGRLKKPNDGVKNVESSSNANSKLKRVERSMKGGKENES